MTNKLHAQTLPLVTSEFEFERRCPHVAEIVKATNNENYKGVL